MYNIYYLFRRRGTPAQRVRAVVHFMLNFYEPEQLVTAAQHIADELTELQPEQRQYHYQVYSDLLNQAPDDALRDQLTEIARDRFSQLPALPDFLSCLIESPSSNSMDQELSTTEYFIDQIPPKLLEDFKNAKQYISSSQFDKAENTYRKALEINPESQPLWLSLGNLLRRLERFEEAEEAHRKALEIDPEFHMIWLSLGNLLQHLERFEEAEEAYRKALEINPESQPLWLLLSELLRRLERFEEAEEACRKALEINPESHMTWAVFHTLRLKLDGCSEVSINQAEEMIRQRPANLHLMNALAWAIFESGQPLQLERALKWANNAVMLSANNNGSYQHTLSSIQCALDRIDDALKSASKYLMDFATVRKTIDDATQLFIELSARGEASRALQILVESPAAQELEPLVVGIRLFLGENVKVAAEVLEIGYDVAKRIQLRQQELDTHA